MKRILLYILGILIVIIQNSIINYLSILGITINLVLIYLVIVSLYIDELEAGIMGAILGLILDSSVGAIFGSNALILFLIAYIVSYLKDKMYKESLIIIFTLILISTFVYCAASLFITKYVFAIYKMKSILKLIVVPIVNAIAGVLIYKVFEGAILNLEEE